MLLWKRPETTAGALLLSAASLLPLSAGSQVLASEPAGRSAVTPLEQFQDESAQQRWERLKGRYQPSLIESAPSSNALSAQGLRGSRFPLSDAPAAQSSSHRERNFAPPLPDGIDEPAWLTAGVPVEVLDEIALDPQPKSRPQPPLPTEVPFVEHRGERNQPAVVPREAAPESARLASVDPQAPRPLVAFAANANRASQADPALAPVPGSEPVSPGKEVRRSVRSISEIQPFYNTMVDEDIREFADKSAAEYGVEFGADVYEPRAFPEAALPWVPTNYYHFPLYFEDAVLERYGHSYPEPIQPFVSVAKFSGQLLALPYQMTLDPINKPKYTLGWYRPGEVAPKLRYQVPWNAQAAAVQAGVTTGLIFLIP